MLIWNVITYSISLISHFEIPSTFIFLNRSFSSPLSALTSSMVKGSTGETPISGIPLTKYGSANFDESKMQALSFQAQGLMKSTESWLNTN